MRTLVIVLKVLHFNDLKGLILRFDLILIIDVGPVWVNGLIKHLFYKSLLEKNLYYKYFIQ